MKTKHTISLECRACTSSFAASHASSEREIVEMSGIEPESEKVHQYVLRV